MSNVTNYLGPAEIAAYQLRAQQAETAANRALANLTTQKSYATQDFGLTQDQANRNWAQTYHQLPGAFARRNVMRSGIFQAARQNSAQTFQDALANLQRQYERTMGGYNTQAGDIESIRNMTLQQIEAERLARQEQLAAQLRDVTA